MSIEAVAAVMGFKVGDAKRKLMLMGWANHAHSDGRNSYAKPATIARYAECSTRTVQRHLPILLSTGYLREGDQSIVAHLPADKRPIVYDVAMTKAQVAKWAADYEAGVGVRSRYEAAGAEGGRRAAELRTERGDNLTPRAGRGDTVVTPGGVTELCHPNRHVEPSKKRTELHSVTAHFAPDDDAKKIETPVPRGPGRRKTTFVDWRSHDLDTFRELVGDVVVSNGPTWQAGRFRAEDFYWAFQHREDNPIQWPGQYLEKIAGDRGLDEWLASQDLEPTA